MKKWNIFFILAVLLVIPLTLVASSQRQIIKQNAQTPATETKNMEVTFYGWPDNDPPSANIALPGIHQEAGGTGTYEDPVTFATDPNEFPAGTKVYVPFLKKYAVMEDTCAQCISDWSGSQKYHIDIWMTSDANSGDDVIQCENQWTKETTPVEINPPQGREVFAGDIFDPQTKTCLQAIPASSPSVQVSATQAVQPTATVQPNPTAITPVLYCLGACPTTPAEETPAVSPTTGTVTTPTTGSVSPTTGSVSPTTGTTQPTPTVAPCANDTASVFGGKKKKHKKHRGGGFFEQFFRKFFQFFMKFLERFGFQMPTDPAPTPDPGSPCPEPTDTPEPTDQPEPTNEEQPTQAPSTAPSGAVTPTVFNTTPTTPASPSPSGTQTGGGKSASVKITFYGSYDNDPKGSLAIANPVIHDEAGGTGTYADPLTFASPAGNGAYKFGQIIYVPLVQKYFIREDECAVSWTAPNGCGAVTMVDLYVGNPSSSEAVVECENSLTPSGNTEIIIDPPNNLTVSSEPIWNQSTGACMSPKN